MLQKHIVRDERGVDRCDRHVMLAVQNVVGDDSKGYHNVEAKCGMPIVQRVSDGAKGCSRCDKEPPIGNVHPRVTNAAGVKLTEKELQECGLMEDTSLKPAKTKEPTTKTLKTIFPVEGKVTKIKKDVVILEVPLSELETDDVARALIAKVIDGLDVLPVNNFKESRRLMVLRDKLLKSLEA